MGEAFYVKGKRNSVIYLVCLCLMITGVLSLLSVSQNYQELTGQAKVRDGMLDLAQTKFSEWGYVYLNGVWEFLPEGAIAAQNETEETLIHVPGRWMRSAVMGQPTFKGDHGSYRLTLTNATAGERMIVLVPGMLSDYSIYINGQKIVQNGQTGFIAPSSTLDVVIEIQSERLGGLYLTPQLMRYELFEKYYPPYAFMMIALFADLAFASVLFFVISIAGNTKRNYKFLFLFSMMTVLRYMVKVLSNIPDFRKNLAGSDMELLAPAIFLFTVGCAICATFMTEQMSPDLGNKKIRNILFGVLLTFAAVACFNWNSFYYRYLELPIFCLVLSVFGYIIWVAVKAIRKGVDYALMMGIGTIVIAFGLIVDTLNVNEYFVFDVSFVLPWCIVAFLLLYAIILSKNEQKLYDTMERNIRMQQEVINMEAVAMAQRMQPHFLYNALTAIQEMCYTEPRKAAEMIANFAAYLRMNIDFLKQPEEIPFEQELRFIENYMNIQKERFGGELIFESKIETTDFMIPPLTIEPLIENAAQHGVKNRAGEKFILLYVKKEKEEIIIEVQDNGRGFDVNEIMKNENNTLSHIVKRLSYWKNATLEIISGENEGTRILIHIPAEREKK